MDGNEFSSLWCQCTGKAEVDSPTPSAGETALVDSPTPSAGETALMVGVPQSRDHLPLDIGLAGGTPLPVSRLVAAGAVVVPRPGEEPTGCERRAAS